MAVIKCKMCGGNLIIVPGSAVAECEFCGSKQTIPNQDNDKKLTLFARANRLRIGGEFDKAAGIYESIVADFPEEAEAYWGLVLCKYGIEYVDDSATGKKVPTCHRSTFDSVMDDKDFEQACENADGTARRLYREEAKSIEEIRRGIIEVSSKEEPYDIFICYKETDEDGNRTLDSVIAQDVYDALTAKGYRVFFSRISLEDKLGQEYEPFIFAALNSARIMLAFGTDFEYYNAVWVKNEWSRFLRLMAKDKNKHLIPCFKNIDAYDMPKEFVKLQSQDMDKVGAIQDLLRGIDKILNKPVTSGTNIQNAAEEAVRTMEQEKTRKQVENAVSLGIMAVDSEDFTKAEKHFEEALKLDSECIGAYLGLARIISDNGRVAPYVKKILSIPANRVLDYIKLNRGIIGNLQNSNNLLTIAVKTIGSEEIIEGILDMGINADAKDALAYYLNRFKNCAIVKKMIDCGANINATIWWRRNYKKDYESYFKKYYESYNREFHSVLSTAVDARQSKQIIELLVNAGADVNHSVKIYHYSREVGETANGSLVKTFSILSSAAANYSNEDVAELLIKAGANVNFVVKEGKDTVYSILGYAVFCKKYGLAKLLLEHGADPNQKRTASRKYCFDDGDGDVHSSSTVEEYSPISDTIWRIKDPAMLQLLLNYGGNPNVFDKRAIVRMDEKKTRWLCGYAKYNPILDALFYSTPEFLQILLDNGADPNIKYYYDGISKNSYATVMYKSEIPVLGVSVIAKDSNAINMLIKAGASFSTDAVYQTRGHYNENVDGHYEWNEDRFPLSKYAFSDEVVAKVGDIIRANGWRGKGFLEKRHYCQYRA